MNRIGTLFQAEPARLETGTLAGLLAITAALLSLGAAAIHFAVLGTHFKEWWAYGFFFAVIAWLQGGWALIVVNRRASWLYWTGAAGNAAIIAIWAVTRTAGNFAGPALGQVESAQFIDVLATVFEGLIVLACLVLLLWRERAEWGIPPAAFWGVALLVAGWVALLTSVSLADFAGSANVHSGTAHGAVHGTVEGHQTLHQPPAGSSSSEVKP